MVKYTLEQRWEMCLRWTYRRCRLCEKKIIFSDEAYFDLGGYVNMQICCIWGTENPHAYIESQSGCYLFVKDVIGIENCCVS